MRTATEVFRGNLMKNALFKWHDLYSESILDEVLS